MTARWALAALLFLLGLGLRLTVFQAPHEEADEYIYMTLVVQLDTGHGYTLQGSRILEENLLDRVQYDRPLFFHPPGGIALYWLFYKVVGDWGFAVVPVVCYGLFFAAMLLLAGCLQLTSSTVGLTTVAALSACSPILAHVSTRFWLDGPLLAFTTAAAAIFVWSVVRNRPRWALAAGLLLGYASLIKITAFLVVPGVGFLAWFLRAPFPPRRFVRLLLFWILPAIAVQLPWELWQWAVVGSPFPSWAGKPSASLIATNPYVRYLTEIRSPWVYVTLTPRILWTWVPTLFLYVLLARHPRTRRFGFSLLLWIATVVAFHVAVGSFGYSKVIRYIILVTPASVLLFSLLLEQAAKALRARRSWVLGAAVTVALLGAGLEIASGIDASLSTERDFMTPILGKDGQRSVP